MGRGVRAIAVLLVAAAGCDGGGPALVPMPHPRYESAAALGSDGRIYIIGGDDHVATYNPSTDRWSG